jgi:hypothetical protein
MYLQVRPDQCSYFSVLILASPEPTTADPAPALEEVNEVEDVEEGEGPKLLSKKEKERLKKEKEKVDYFSLCVAEFP